MSPQANPRTEFSVRRAGAQRAEIISGERHCWRFRLHFHAGDEVVRILAGRVRLRLPDRTVLVEAGQTVVVPAGTVHRFEAVDAEGWAFRSEFVSAAETSALRKSTDFRMQDPLGLRARNALATRDSLQTDVEAIADALGVSAGYLSRVFRRETGTSLHNFHVLMAIQKAKNLLRDHAPLAFAAADAGFCDQAHLTREFVRTLGMTPGTFRAGWTSLT